MLKTKKQKMILCIALAAVILCAAIVTTLVLVLKDGPSEVRKNYTDESPRAYNVFLNDGDDEVEIGVEGVTSWKFRKNGDVWLFDGVYALDGKHETKVFTGSSGKVDENDALIEDGAYFSILPTDRENGFDKYVGTFVNDIRVKTDDAENKVLELTGKGFTSYLSVNTSSQCVQRDFLFKFDRDVTLSAGDASFVLRSKVEQYDEYGYILSHPADEPQHPVPYSFPGIASRLTTKDGQNKIYSYVNIVDYYGTSSMLKIARRNKSLTDFFEIGLLSDEGVMQKGEEYTLSEKIVVKEGENDSFYDLIYDARYEYALTNPVSLEEMIAVNSNMRVDEWDEAAYRLTYELIDGRGRPLGDDMGLWGPYGYNNAGGESFASMNVLKGLVRYAIATEDEQLYDFALDKCLQLITPDPVYGHCYIMPMNTLPQYRDFGSHLYFFNHAFSDGTYTFEVSWIPGEMAANSFNYFSKVSQLGEIAIMTDNAQLKQTYLDLMVFLKKMDTEDFVFGVEFAPDGSPSMDFENGGSGGAAAMWGYCMYVASLIETDADECATYMEYVKGATDRFNTQGFERSSALRDYPKPESIGYGVRLNLVMYKTTGDEHYLNKALETVRGVYMYYFMNSHPGTYFQTVGFGYACNRERWEAFMEMVETLSLISPILEYTNDPLLFELYACLRETALWCLPINGYPEGVLGGHCDWLDALYIPFEQPTGHIGDNPGYDGAGSSWRRWSKELYGSGEIYIGALLFETFGKAIDSNVIVINYTATGTVFSTSGHSYKLYNIGTQENQIISFGNYENGIYEVLADGVSLGKFTDEQLENGIRMNLEQKKPVHVQIVKCGDLAENQAVDKNVTITLEEMESNWARIKVSASGADHYRFAVSSWPGFDKFTTQYKITDREEMILYFEENSKLYVKVYAYDASGNQYKESNVLTFESDGVLIGAEDDFSYTLPEAGSSVGGWVGTAQVYDGDVILSVDQQEHIDYPTEGFSKPRGYMAVYKPDYFGKDVDTFTKDFGKVDITKYNYFDFQPYTKNNGSQFSLQLKIGDGEFVTLLDKVSHFDKNLYRFDLSEVTDLTGEQNVTVRMISEGYNRGFAIEKMRFVKPEDYSDAYALTSLNYTTDAKCEKTDAGLVITNPDEIPAKTEFVLDKFDPTLYTSLEITYSGMTAEQNGFVGAYVELYLGEGTDGAPVYTKTVGTLRQEAIEIEIGSGAGQANLTEESVYTLVVEFRRGTTVVDNIEVGSIRLKGVNADTTTEGYNPATGYVDAVRVTDGNFVAVNGWNTVNQAFVNPKDGYIYNDNPNVGYSSITRRNVAVNIDKTPIIRFSVSGIKEGSYWSFGLNDGTLATDIALVSTSNQTGVFEFDLKDVFNRSGNIMLVIEFYVIHDRTTDLTKGVKFDGFAFVEGRHLYDDVYQTPLTETVSDAFALNTSVTPYVSVDIATLTYGSTWLMYLVDEDGNKYELKNELEQVYGKMYYRKKAGAYKYDLREILPESLQNKDVTMQLMIMLDGNGSQMQIVQLRLSKTNETLVQQHPVFFGEA